MPELLRRAARLAGLVPVADVRPELGRLRSAIAAVATVAREERGVLAERLEAVERELEETRAIVGELYVAPAERARG